MEHGGTAHKARVQGLVNVNIKHRGQIITGE
jgi:hypothetical protein